MRLPASFLTRPIAHRALHDGNDVRPENSLSAVRAAIDSGYGIEIDLQLSSDGEAMVFHDYSLDRMTAESGLVRDRTAEELGRIDLKGSAERIPRLEDVLAVVDGQVPLLIELKDQDGALGPDVGPLEQAVADALASYDGDVAVMSFNPHSVLLLKALLPATPRGLTTEDFVLADDWDISRPRRQELNQIGDAEAADVCFISHSHRHLAMGRVNELKGGGMTILCWTVKSPEEEAEARKVADNVTFEGYLA